MSNRVPIPPGVDTIRLTLAFAAIYFIWGSTYLAIRFAIETIPPFLMMALRSILAGTALYAWARLRGAPAPRREQWGTAAIIGTFLFFGGHGALSWAEQRVPSGAAALVLATIPIWMTLLEAFRRGGHRLTGRVMVGLTLGFGGVALLAEPHNLFGGGAVDLVGVIVLQVGALSWCIGSMRSKTADLPESSTLTSGMFLLTGGAVLAAAGLLRGETFSPAEVSLRSWLSLVYLAVFGSIIAFAAFAWLMRVANPARVSTYGFVNPVVAVLVGWFLGGEALSPRLLVAVGMMVTGVATIVTGAQPRRASGTGSPLVNSRGSGPSPTRT